MNYKEVRKRAEEKDKEITCKDLNYIVYVYHFDRSELTYYDAMMETIEDGDGKWFIIYTEHHGFHVYHSEDIETITVQELHAEKRESQREKIQRLEKDLVNLAIETVRLQNRYDNLIGK